MDFLRRGRPWIDFLGSTGSSSMALLIAGISGIATVFGALRACAGRLLAGGFETCSSTKIGRQQRGRFKLFLHELRIDLALLFRLSLLHGTDSDPSASFLAGASVTLGPNALCTSARTIFTTSVLPSTDSFATALATRIC